MNLVKNELGNTLPGLDEKEWFINCVSDCKIIKTETGTRVKLDLLEGRWQIGERLNKERENIEVSKNSIIELMGSYINMKRSTLLRCMKFNDKYPNFQDFISYCKNTDDTNLPSWRDVCYNILQEPKPEKEPKPQLAVDHTIIDTIINGLSEVLEDEQIVNKIKPVIYPEFEKAYKQIQMEKMRGDFAIKENAELKAELKKLKTEIKNMSEEKKKKKEATRIEVFARTNEHKKVYKEWFEKIKGFKPNEKSSTFTSGLYNIGSNIDHFPLDEFKKILYNLHWMKDEPDKKIQFHITNLSINYIYSQWDVLKGIEPWQGEKSETKANYSHLEKTLGVKIKEG